MEYRPSVLLIEQDTGRKAAIEVARMLVVYLKRSGGQSQYSALLEAQAESDSNTFADLELWIAEHLTENLRVEALAERIAAVAEACGFSDEEQMRSTFIRVLGVPPRDYRKHFTATTA